MLLINIAAVAFLVGQNDAASFAGIVVRICNFQALTLGKIETVRSGAHFNGQLATLNVAVVLVFTVGDGNGVLVVADVAVQINVNLGLAGTGVAIAIAITVAIIIVCKCSNGHRADAHSQCDAQGNQFFHILSHNSNLLKF